ncbi:septal ring lytic transglycosylase RlpA family protein [Corallococcus carmarthensis]|uniref:septal ring lytic transglycosylase RlpA family protein n=1 Tax=Corallococcus carmarthensis TaxID=2316728 RepID=UPI00148E8B33|nr:septal ring lytic transglycosylase RlpA family protein [Corallococcus carmarthensis]NOK19798.1 septal ring lytic transglycosylase RlpA family protein [Corallococcus carmarthensis]
MQGRTALLLLGMGFFAGCASRAAKPQPPETSSSGDEGTKVTRREKMPRNYLGEGLASFYGPGLHGRPTASGEKFNQNALTAAHRSERFGSCVKVMNMENGRQVEVRVNDRGPFVDGRIIDVSKAAAKQLGMLDKGLARVRLFRCGDRVSQVPVEFWAAPA